MLTHPLRHQVARNFMESIANVPSPERIRELTAEIRKHWTPRERRRRAGLVHRVELLEMPLVPRRKGFSEESF